MTQESVRWLLARDKVEDAETVITKIAAIQHRKTPVLHQIGGAADDGTAGVCGASDEKSKERIYTVIYVLKSKKRARITLPLLFMW